MWSALHASKTLDEKKRDVESQHLMAQQHLSANRTPEQRQEHFEQHLLAERARRSAADSATASVMSISIDMTDIPAAKDLAHFNTKPTTEGSPALAALLLFYETSGCSTWE